MDPIWSIFTPFIRPDIKWLNEHCNHSQTSQYHTNGKRNNAQSTNRFHSWIVNGRFTNRTGLGTINACTWIVSLSVDISFKIEIFNRLPSPHIYLVSLIARFRFCHESILVGLWESIVHLKWHQWIGYISQKIVPSLWCACSRIVQSTTSYVHRQTSGSWMYYRATTVICIVGIWFVEYYFDRINILRTYKEEKQFIPMLFYCSEQLQMHLSLKKKKTKLSYKPFQLGEIDVGVTYRLWSGAQLTEHMPEKDDE